MLTFTTSKLYNEMLINPWVESKYQQKILQALKRPHTKIYWLPMYKNLKMLSDHLNKRCVRASYFLAHACLWLERVFWKTLYINHITFITHCHFSASQREPFPCIRSFATASYEVNQKYLFFLSLSQKLFTLNA